MTTGSSYDCGFSARFDDAANDALHWAVLLIVFNGDAAAWASYLAREGSSSQRTDDLTFAQALERSCVHDAELRHRLRDLATEFQSRPH